MKKLCIRITNLAAILIPHATNLNELINNIWEEIDLENKSEKNETEVKQLISDLIKNLYNVYVNK